MIALLIALSGVCGWQAKMSRMLTASEVQAYGQPPSVVQDQMAGFFTGGGVSVRSSVKNKNLIGFEPPVLTSGCNGIDLFTGGISYIRSQELVKTLKAIAASSASYAFGLAVQTVTPQIKAVLDTVHTQMMRINALSLNSCEKAAALVSGLWPKTEAARQMYCSTKGVGLGRFDDWAGARHGCATQAGYESVERVQDRRFLSLLGMEYNLVWEALQKRSAIEEEWQELFLSLTGTVVRARNGETKVLISLCQSEEWLRVLVGMEKGQLPVYKCVGDRCLTVTVEDVEMRESLCEKILELLNSILAKIYDGAPLSLTERAFVENSRVPILRMLTVNAMSHQEVMDHHEIAQVVAFDMVIRWVEYVMSLVQDAVNNIRSSQIDDVAFELFLKNLRHARRVLQSHKRGFYSHMRSVISLVERSRLLERKALSYAQDMLQLQQK